MSPKHKKSQKFPRNFPFLSLSNELGRNPASEHQIQPEYGDEQADAGRDCRDRLATKFSGTNADKGIVIFPVQLTTSRIGNLTRLIHTLAISVTIHTYIHTYINTHTYIH